VGTCLVALLIRRTYTYLDEQSFKYLFQALVRPHIEYAEAVWSPFKVGDIEKKKTYKEEPPNY
jgi:hypothetical protein